MFQLAKIRKSLHLTQQDLASTLNIPRATIAMWETGRAEPNHDNLIILANFFKCSTDELLGINNEYKKPILIKKIPILSELSRDSILNKDKYTISFFEHPYENNQYGEKDFAYQIKTDMLYHYKINDIVLINENDTLQTSWDAFVLIKEQLLLADIKRTKIGVTIFDKSDNYSAHIYTNKEINLLPITMIGTIFGFLRKKVSNFENHELF